MASLLDNKEAIIHNILLETNISKNTLYRYWNIKKDDTRSAPADFLRIVSKELDCSVDELYND